MRAWDLGEPRPDACGVVGWLREPVHCTTCTAQGEALETAPVVRPTLVLWQTGAGVYAEVWT